MRPSLGRVGFAVLAASLCAPAIAQEQRGAIDGIVRDAQGAATPGAAVLARSATGLSVEGVADGSGTYRFASLPPGRYELTASLSGFSPARVVNIELALGVELRIDLTLQPAGVAETVEVVGESPLVAITQSSRATSLRGEEIEKMPKGRDFTSLVTQAAGVVAQRKSGYNTLTGEVGISVDGSSGAENRVVVDGVETGNVYVGVPGLYVVTDFVEEVQVKSSGYSAEYGGSTGAVLNAITKTGTNAWHGDALLYWSDADLDADPRPSLRLDPTNSSVAQYVTYPEDPYRRLEPGFTFSGPLVRDRLWLFAGYVPSFGPLDRTVTFLSDGTTGTFRQDWARHHAAVNLSGQFGPRWRAKAAFSMGRLERRGALPAQDGTSNPAADYSIDWIYPNYTASASVDYTPGSRAMISLRGGYFFNNWYNEGMYRGDRYQYGASALGLPGVPPEYQQPRLYSNVPNNYGVDREKGPHLGIQLDGTVYFDAAGHHQLKGGVQYDRIGLDMLEGYTGNTLGFYWGQGFSGQRGPFGYYRLGSNDVFPNLGPISQGEASVNNLGFFLQDAWTIGGRLTLHLGLRTENEHVPSLLKDPRAPENAMQFGFGDKLAPRVGFAWDATGDGKTKIYGSWGVFYDITKLSLTAGFGGANSLGYWYTLDTGDISTIVDNAACPPTCPGRLILGPIQFAVPTNDPDDNRIDPGVRQMRMQEAVVGVEREIAPNLSASARYVHKQLDRAVEDIGTIDAQQNELYTVGNPGYGWAATFYPQGGTDPIPVPKAKRDYDAVEIGLNRRLSNHWSARASYTLSRLYGNYSGLAQSDEDGRVSPNVGRNFDYPMMSFDENGAPVYGVLATDRPHQLKAQVLFDFPFGTSVGASWFGASGIPRTREAAFIPGNAFPVMYLGRNSDGRLPFFSQLDLYAQHQLRLGSKVRLTLSANVINLLNQGIATNYFQTELFQGQAVKVAETEFYQGIDTQALIAQQKLVRDARFLMASGFQAPRSIRLGVKLGF